MLLFFAVSLAANTKIYKVVKADGTVVYTDKPPLGAEEFKFKGKANVVPSAPTKPVIANRNFGQIGGQQPVAQQISYDLAIISPSNEQTIRSNEGKVTISARLSPSARGTFELILNGEVHATSSTPQFPLVSLDRGEYNIKINFLDQTGKLLASTPQGRFYIQKVSALLRAN